MKTAEHIIETVDKLVRKYHTRDPYELCQLLGIKIHYYDLQKKLKGFFYYQSRQKNIVIDHNVNGILERILVAHELGHAVLHTKIAMMHGFQEMEVFDDRSIEENEANFFAAELLLEDGKVLECLSEHTFFETAKMLYVPAALLDYKFSLLHEKGELVNSMYIRKADFLKEDLHAVAAGLFCRKMDGQFCRKEPDTDVRRPGRLDVAGIFCRTINIPRRVVFDIQEKGAARAAPFISKFKRPRPSRRAVPSGHQQ